ncbi:hypothetical protein BCON_0234g00030 [Botryotinia convoluta]|uniref:Uncharacterized protein n=1 Tax=Botryotinia convoluta TaxID=54673 RepID=A0A4Z1HHY2_9HELO|nr:hypothetical protein BCON_0234g00030 [Botryotinia convoluta]
MVNVHTWQMVGSALHAVTREQHLFFEENDYLIITDALNEQEIKNHKFWAEVVPEPRALWPVQFSDMIRWLILSRQGGEALEQAREAYSRWRSLLPGWIW